MLNMAADGEFIGAYLEGDMSTGFYGEQQYAMDAAGNYYSAASSSTGGKSKGFSKGGKKGGDYSFYGGKGKGSSWYPGAGFGKGKKGSKKGSSKGGWGKGSKGGWAGGKGASWGGKGSWAGNQTAFAANYGMENAEQAFAAEQAYAGFATGNYEQMAGFGGETGGFTAEQYAAAGYEGADAGALAMYGDGSAYGNYYGGTMCIIFYEFEYYHQNQNSSSRKSGRERFTS